MTDCVMAALEVIVVGEYTLHG